MPAYLDSNTNTYYVKFYYTDWTGERKQKLKRGFKLKREAAAFERKFLDKLQGTPDMLFSSLVELYLEDMKSRLKPSTLYTKKYMIDDKILPTFEKLRINEIKPTQIRKWQNELIGQNFSQTYLKTINNQLVAIFNYAMRYYDLKENPCHKAGSMGKKYADKMQIWTKEEFTTFINTVEDETYQIAYNTLYWTGCRLGELLALNVGDIDLAAKTMSISKSLQRMKKEDIITLPKTPKSNRTVTLPDFLVTALQEHINKLYGCTPEDRLFINVSKYWLHENKRKGIKLSGVKDIRIHDFRHSHASLLIELGFSPILISERLGHEKIETTLNIYGHLYPNKHAEVATKLQEIVSNQYQSDDKEPKQP